MLCNAVSLFPPLNSLLILLELVAQSQLDLAHGPHVFLWMF